MKSFISSYALPGSVKNESLSQSLVPLRGIKIIHDLWDYFNNDLTTSFRLSFEESKMNEATWYDKQRFFHGKYS